MSPITHYLRSSSILASNSPSYDANGRQLPFTESHLQRRERHAFVKSLQWQRNIATWMNDQRHSALNPHPSVHLRSFETLSDSNDFVSTHSPSTSSSESSSPRTPASPLNTPHTHTPQYHTKQQQVLDAELAKLALVDTDTTAQTAVRSQNCQRRNYKNLHLPNTTAAYTPRYRNSTRSQQRTLTPSRGVFDSDSYTYPPAPSYSSRTEDVDQLRDSGEPYILYSSTPKQPSTLPTTSTPTSNPTPGIGEFPRLVPPL